jgi:hypothetical protein
VAFDWHGNCGSARVSVPAWPGRHVELVGGDASGYGSIEQQLKSKGQAALERPTLTGGSW